jgi:predicted HicB family RNase H-like nuclease
MSIETRKISFIQEFLKLQSEEIIIDLENLLHKQKAELIEKGMKPMSLEKFNSNIDKSIDDVLNHRLISAEDLKIKF